MVVDYEIPTLPHTISGRSSMRSIADAVEALRNTGAYVPIQSRRSERYLFVYQLALLLSSF